SVHPRFEFRAVINPSRRSETQSEDEQISQVIDMRRTDPVFACIDVACDAEPECLRFQSNERSSHAFAVMREKRSSDYDRADTPSTRVDEMRLRLAAYPRLEASRSGMFYRYRFWPCVPQ